MSPLFLLAVVLTASDVIWANEICCSETGCFNDSSPFNTFPLPECQETMGVEMQVYTRQNPENGENITRNSIPSCFKDNVLTVFLVHGWGESAEFPWMADARDALLAQGDYNVILVNWKRAADYYWYPQSASNTRTVGAEIALVAKRLIKYGKVTKAEMHCTGHSLGSHVCGNAGNGGGTFGRITGLDPAGPGFENRDSSVGLNPTCADLVDVIHTSKEFGIWKPIGHVDFYVNGGANQPGCTSDVATELTTWTDYDKWDATKQDASLHLVAACSHMRVTELFIASIRQTCFTTSYHCKSHLFVNKLCPNDATQSMGFGANKQSGRGIFYLSTCATAPFCPK